MSVLVIAAGLLFASFLKADTDLVAGSNGRITGVNEVTMNGTTTFRIYAAVGVGPDEGAQLACSVVRPILLRDGYADAHFFVLDRAGDILATESTSCGLPSPSANPVSSLQSEPSTI